MSSAKEDTLSSDELRKRLYQTFKSKGVLDTLKTQLRNQLVHEFKQASLTGGEPVPRPVSVKCEPNLVSACNNVVADHLRTCGYEYTLSVFYPESGLCRDKVSSKDLLQLLKISPESSLYRSLSSNKDDKGLLIGLLTHHHAHEVCRDADTQTTSVAGCGESLVEKMKMIDKEYENVIYSGDRWVSFDSKLAAYRKEIEAQMQAEMNTKMQHFKDVEIARVRMEEKGQFHKEFDKLKQDLEMTYERKTKALTEREKNAIDRLQKQQEIEEKNVYMQRQSVLKEIETLRNRENELRFRVESFEKTCHIHDEKVKNIEELLRRREVAVRTLEDTHDQRLKNELSRYQLELKEEHIKRTEKLTENENRNKVETARIQKESAVIEGKLEEHSRACSELRRLQVELDRAEQRISQLIQQKELLTERLETMSDYPSLKRETAEQQGQLRLLKKQLEEAQETNRHLHEDLGKPSKEQLVLQMELRRLQSARRLDEEEFDNQKQVLQARLQSEVERCAKLNAQLIEYKEKSQWMSDYNQDIKMQLRQTQQALLRARVGCDDLFEAGGPVQERERPWLDSPDSDMDVGADAKARILELQKEAETLEEAYRNCQQRAVHPTATLRLPSRPLSPQQAHHSHRPDSPLRKQTSHLPRTRSSHKSKIPHRPLPPPQTTRTPSSPPNETNNTAPLTQSRVTLSEDVHQPQKSIVLTDHGLHSFPEPLFRRDEVPQERSGTPSARHSSSRNNLPRDISGEAAVSQVAFPEELPDRQLPCASPIEAVTSGDSSSELSSPQSPQMKSTTRDQSSPTRLQPVLSTTDSSPQPEKISLGDLTEPSYIPELLLDTAVPLSEEAPDGPANPHPSSPPEVPVDFHGQAEVPQTSGESPRGEEEEDEEQRWKREQKERQERRQREQKEAREREQQELKRLEEEMLFKEVEQPAQEEGGEEEAAVEKGADEVHKQEVDDNGRAESKDENPLEKYMKMLLESEKKQQTQIPGREEEGQTSPEAKSLSDEKDDSIAAYEHKDEDDGFW